MSASAPAIPPIRTREEVVVGRRAAAMLLVALAAGLAAAGALLAHEIRLQREQTMRTHLGAALQSAVDEVAREAVQAQQQAAGLAALPSLQRALAARDHAALTRLTSPVPGATATPGSTPPAGSAADLQRAVQVISGGHVLGTVTVRVPLDGALLARLRAVVPLRPGEGLLLVRRQHIVAAPHGLEAVRLRPTATSLRLPEGSFYVTQAPLLGGSAAVRVATLAPTSEVDGPMSRIERVLAFALTATLATLALLARLLARPILLPLQRLARAAESSLADELTGLPNRRAFDEAAARELGRAQRSGLPLGVAMIDVDDFKRINDTFGHDAGDHVLRVIGEVLGEQFREIDVPSRYGGEEFAVLLPDTTLPGAREAAERFRVALAERRVGDGEQLPLHVTASVGVASRIEAGVEDLLRAADQALYRAKRAGKNRVETDAA